MTDVSPAADVSYPADGFTLFPDRSVVALRVDGELKDLATVVAATDVVEPVTVDSPDGLAILRHSTAHVLAQAVQRIRPQANLGIGPPITDGFYYDFGVADPFTPEDLKAIKKEMERIVRENQRFVRRVVTEHEARAEMADEPFKLELIGLAGGPGAGSTEGASVEVGGGELTIYDNVTRDGDTAWRDEWGYYWYVGRADDLIKSSGYRIGPFEIESVIMELPYVLECGVSGAPDEIRGQVIKASIVLTAGTEGTDELKTEIQEYVKAHTAPYKYPRIVEFVSELPKTTSGKIRRVEIRGKDQGTVGEPSATKTEGKT